MKKRALIITTLTLTALGGCSYPRTSDTAEIYETAKNTGLLDRIESADYVLLGEKHDNPHHHKIQTEILKTSLVKGDLVVFEMITSDQQPIIDRYLKDDIKDDTLEAALNWKKSGWPEWAFYAPLFSAAKKAGAVIKYGSYPRKQLMDMSEDKSPLAKLLPSNQLAALDEDMRASHCNMLPEEMLRPMSLLQIKKDKLLADQLLTRETSQVAYLIAGRGHVRKDRAVPIHLKALKAEKIFVLSLAEEMSEPDEWELFSSFDAVWITESLGKTQEEYCAEMLTKFKKP